MSGTPDFGSKVFAAWREAAGPAWPAYTGHAFVRGLGDGTLPREAFLHYLKQDYIFLFHFARAWALAVRYGMCNTRARCRCCAVSLSISRAGASAIGMALA